MALTCERCGRSDATVLSNGYCERRDKWLFERDSPTTYPIYPYWRYPYSYEFVWTSRG